MQDYAVSEVEGVVISWRHPKIIATGLALFAMFFGAGNMIFPLYLGAHAGQNLWWVALGFLLMGVGTPFLGLFATSLFEGDYWAFFDRLGAVSSFAIVSFTILVIGPLFAAPRTEVVTFNTLLPFLPSVLQNPYLFSAIFCSLVFALTYRKNQLIALLGYILSPIKLIAFFTLIVVALWHFQPIQPVSVTAFEAFAHGLANGYSTMDMLASFFFCTLAYTAIQKEAHAVGIHAAADIRWMTLRACLIGAVALSAVYLGFILVTAGHAASLQLVVQEKIIDATARAVLGKYGAFFVCLCVFFACLATAIALAEISTHYLHEKLFVQRVPRTVCLSLVVVVMFIMTGLGFSASWQLRVRY